jgi:prevent-host-death family protein
METFTVRDLRDRTGALIQGAEAGKMALVTKHGRPVFVALPFDEKLLEQGVLTSLAVKLFDEEVLTQGQAAKLAGLSLAEFLQPVPRGRCRWRAMSRASWSRSSRRSNEMRRRR